MPTFFRPPRVARRRRQWFPPSSGTGTDYPVLVSAGVDVAVSVSRSVVHHVAVVADAGVTIAKTVAFLVAGVADLAVQSVRAVGFAVTAQAAAMAGTFRKDVAKMVTSALAVAVTIATPRNVMVLVQAGIGFVVRVLRDFAGARKRLFKPPTSSRMGGIWRGRS